MMFFPYLDIGLWLVLIIVLWCVVGWRWTLALFGVMLLIVITCVLLGFLIHLTVLP